MKVSIIITTYNRKAQALTLLRTLASQTYRDFEVVISIDGSQDGTADALALSASEFYYPIKVVEHPNIGRAASRNAGAEHAKGDLLIFFDDDVRPNIESVSRHIEFHAKHQNSFLDGPAIYDRNFLNGDFQRFRAKMEEGWYLPSSVPIKREIIGGINGNNFSIRRSLFWSIGGLNPKLNDAEDFEFVFRAFYHHHVDIYSDYRTWVFHDDNKDLKEYLLRKQDVYESWPKIFELHPGMLSLCAEKFSYRPARWKQPVFDLLRANWARTLASSKIFKKLVPIDVRDYIYGLFLAAIRPKI